MVVSHLSCIPSDPFIGHASNDLVIYFLQKTQQSISRRSKILLFSRWEEVQNMTTCTASL